jgi:hypothetical protein
MGPVAATAEYVDAAGQGAHAEPFFFYTERRLVELTGLSARSLAELAAILRQVPGSSIFYHTHHLFLSHHFEKPVVYNEFALWVGEALQEQALAEKLAAIDLREFTSIRQLREAILAVVEQHLRQPETALRVAPPGDEFHFCKSKSFVMPTGMVAHDVREFFALLRQVTNISFYFHFLEARLRLERSTNDFSQWLSWRGETALAAAIDALDPYMRTLDELKADLLALGRRHGYG